MRLGSIAPPKNSKSQIRMAKAQMLSIKGAGIDTATKAKKENKQKKIALQLVQPPKTFEVRSPPLIPPKEGAVNVLAEHKY